MNTISKSQPRRKKKRKIYCYRHTTFWVPGAQERCIRRPDLGAKKGPSRALLVIRNGGFWDTSGLAEFDDDARSRTHLAFTRITRMT